MKDWMEGAEAIGAVDAIFAHAGLEHGRRSTRVGSWKDGERVKRPKPSPTQQSLRANRRLPGVVRLPQWERWPWLQAGFSTRQGGQSIAYGDAELNLGWMREDDAANVAENRKHLVRAVAGRSIAELVTIRQFHSGMIRAIEAEHASLATPEGKAVLRGDGLMTDLPGHLLGVQTADCVPVLLADTRTRAVAVFHAGWRGTLVRIVERGVGAMRVRYGSHSKDLVAAIGPAIGSCCFAVGEEVRFEFESQFAYASSLFSEVYDSDPVREKYPMLFLTARAPGHSDIGPQIHMDLVEANRRQLVDAGVANSWINVVGECTSCMRLKNGTRKYFSHRGEHGFTGRMLSVIGVAGDR